MVWTLTCDKSTSIPNLFISRIAEIPILLRPLSGEPLATVVQDVAKGLLQVCVSVTYRTPKS